MQFLWQHVTSGERGIWEFRRNCCKQNSLVFSPGQICWIDGQTNPKTCEKPRRSLTRMEPLPPQRRDFKKLKLQSNISCMFTTNGVDTVTKRADDLFGKHLPHKKPAPGLTWMDNPVEGCFHESTCYSRGNLFIICLCLQVKLLSDVTRSVRCGFTALLQTTLPYLLSTNCSPALASDSNWLRCKRVYAVAGKNVNWDETGSFLVLFKVELGRRDGLEKNRMQ